MNFIWPGTHMQLLGRHLKKKGVDQKTSHYLVWPPLASTPSHRVGQAVDCGLWNVVPLLFNGCAKLLDIGRNWNTLSYTSTQSIPNMLSGWQVWKNWDIFSFQELCTDPCDMGSCNIMLKHEVMAANEWHDSGPQDPSQYLCAFKLPSIKCNYVRCL